MVSPTINDISDAFPRDLIEFSAKVEAARDRRSAGSTEALHYRRWEGEYHGAQLASLKVRDWQALEILFNFDDMEVVCTDVISALYSLWPEPCWEDDPFDVTKTDPFDFLAEYL